MITHRYPGFILFAQSTTLASVTIPKQSVSWLNERRDTLTFETTNNRLTPVDNYSIRSYDDVGGPAPPAPA